LNFQLETSPRATNDDHGTSRTLGIRNLHEPSLRAYLHLGHATDRTENEPASAIHVSAAGAACLSTRSYPSRGIGRDGRHLAVRQGASRQRRCRDVPHQAGDYDSRPRTVGECNQRRIDNRKPKTCSHPVHSRTTVPETLPCTGADHDLFPQPSKP